MLVSLRTLLRHPGYLVLSVLALALSVGANIAIFSVVNAIWIRPRPIPQADRVVMVMGRGQVFGTSEGYFFAELGLDCYLRRQRIFSHVAGQVATSGENASYLPQIRFDKVPRQVEVVGVTPEYFSVVGATIQGRDFRPEDDDLSAEPVAIVSERVWREFFGSDPTILGNVVAASPRPLRLIGVAPARFQGLRLGEKTDVWLPAKVVTAFGQPGTMGPSLPLLAVARLRDGIPIRDAQRLMSAGVDCDAGGRDGSRNAYDVVPIQEIYGAPTSRTIVIDESAAIQVAAVATGCIFLGGCATLLALIVMHYERRRHELSVRLALGCPPARLRRLVAIELCALGAIGLLAALGFGAVVVTMLPALDFTAGVDFARLDLSFDWRVFLFSGIGVGLTLAVGGFLPMKRATSAHVALELAGARNAPSSLRLRRTVLATHAGAATLVLICAGLLIRAVNTAYSQGAGFDIRRTLFLTLQTASSFGRSEEGPANRAIRAAKLVGDISELPGVQIVGLGEAPLGLDQTTKANRRVTIVGGDRQWTGTLGSDRVDENFHRALGIPLLSGRWLDHTDTLVHDGPRPVLMTATLAQSIWPQRSPIGLIFSIGRGAFQVVGVVGDYPQGSLKMGQFRMFFGATDIDREGAGFELPLVVRSTGNAADLRARVQRLVETSWQNAILRDLATGEEIVARDLGRERLGAAVFGTFGLLTLCLSLTGIFGLVAHYADSHRRELSIRRALGAEPNVVLRQVIHVAMSPVLVGSVIGLLVGAVVASKVGLAFLGVSQLDPITYVTTMFCLTFGGLLASGSAAWRVLRISPAEALKE